MDVQLPAAWRSVLAEEVVQPYFDSLRRFVDEERSAHTVYPPEPEVFAALEVVDFAQVEVVILGQDPYHDANQAHGLAFSVRPGVALPPSLLNIFKELRDDLGLPLPGDGCLIPWARQGVLLLNSVLTVRAHEANSHRNQGWEKFTDAILARVSARDRPATFVLWGNAARKKRVLLDAARHTIIESAHPSPLSARNGFFGSKPFSAINQSLDARGVKPIDWRIGSRGNARANA